MLEESTTLLEEFILDSEQTPLNGGSYRVVTKRLVAMEGAQSNKIEARVIDNHYLIEDIEAVGDSWRRIPLAIVDGDKTYEAEERMYKEAMKIAEKRAKLDGNKVMDLTSKAKGFFKEDKPYLPSLKKYSPTYY